jgi:hypothetical protein
MTTLKPRQAAAAKAWSQTRKNQAAHLAQAAEAAEARIRFNLIFAQAEALAAANQAALIAAAIEAEAAAALAAALPTYRYIAISQAGGKQYRISALAAAAHLPKRDMPFTVYRVIN